MSAKGRYRFARPPQTADASAHDIWFPHSTYLTALSPLIYVALIFPGFPRTIPTTAHAVANPEGHMLEVAPDDPVAYVLSINLHRRHLTESQRAMVGARVKGYEAGRAKERQKVRKGKRSGATPENLTDLDLGDARDKAGVSVSVSGKSVDHAVKVIAEGSPKLQAAVDAGKVAVSVAAKLADLPKAEQNKALAGGKAVPAPTPAAGWPPRIAITPNDFRGRLVGPLPPEIGKVSRPSIRFAGFARLSATMSLEFAGMPHEFLLQLGCRAALTYHTFECATIPAGSVRGRNTLV